MPLDFPASPSVNDTYTFSGRTWKWNGSGWQLTSEGVVGTTNIANDAVTYAKIQNVSATDKLLGRSTAGAGDVEEITCTAAGRALLDDADAAAQRTTLGLGTLATQSGTFSGTSSGTNTGDQTITLTGDVTGSGTGSFAATIASGAITSAKIADGTIVDGDISASAAIADTKLATISTAGKVSNSATTATSANTASAIVARDASGNFTAGTITAALTGNASTATTLQTARTINGTSFNGSANITVTANTTNSLTFNNGGAGGASGSTFNGGSALTVSYNSVGAPSTTGTNASGTWGISISGNAATVTNGVYTSGDQTIAGNKTFSGTTTLGNVVSGFTVTAQSAGAGEGGEFSLAKPSTGSLAGNVILDINTNSLRIFEAGGSFRGAFLDITGCGSQSPLLHGNNVNTYAVGLSGDQTVGGLKTFSGSYLRCAANTGGIQFNGDTAAANALDDYEEGTWTPTLPNGGTFTNLRSRYVKIGNMCHISCYLSGIANIPVNASEFRVGGLPFNGDATTDDFTSIGIAYAGAGAVNTWLPLVVDAGSYIYFHRSDASAAVITNQTNATTLNGNALLMSGWYYAA